MNKIITTCALLFLCMGCRSNSSQDLEKYTIQYSIGQNQFGIVMVEDGGVSTKELRKYALKKAAEIAHEHGYRYFVINQEAEVTVLKTQEGFSQEQAPHNQYYSMIQLHDFGREQLQSDETSSAEEVPGYQIEFSCQETKPSSGKYFDVCDEGWCD